MLEIEIKALCPDLEKFKIRIIESGGVFESAGSERDIYYNHPCRDFRKTYEAFRIRISGSDTYITYKGPKIGDRAKTRFELETPITSADDMDVILEKLGFVKSGEVIKVREIYKISDITICLDRVQGLGDFVELEIISEDKEQAEKIIFDMAEKFGLDKFERRSYLELLLLKKVQ